MPSPIDVVSALETALGDAIAKAEPSVVAIAREKDGKSEDTTAVRGRMTPLTIPPEPQLGFLIFRATSTSRRALITSRPTSARAWSIGDRGEILTTFHVVKGASRLVVRAFDGKVFEAEILAADPRSDLAVIAPREMPGRPRPFLKPITIGDGTKLRKGMFLLALGNPFNAGRDGKAVGKLGHPGEPRPADRLVAGRARRCGSSATTRRCSSSTPSSTWG